jgi:hypothetical protein
MNRDSGSLFAASAEVLGEVHGPVTLDAYIQALEELREKVGGHTLVQKWTVATGRTNAHQPAVAYVFEEQNDALKIKLRIPRFWHSTDLEQHKGQRVVRV